MTSANDATASSASNAANGSSGSNGTNGSSDLNGHPRLIFIRHGQTTANTRQQLDTQLPGAPLTDIGVTQARRLGSALLPDIDRINVIVTSHALRARQTGAGAVAGLHHLAGPGVRLRHIPGVHEIQAGDLEGRNDFDSHRIYLEHFFSWMQGRWDRQIPGGESGTDVLSRYLPELVQLLDDAASQETVKDVVIVSHGAAIRLVSQYLTGVDPEFVVKNRIRNAERIELVARDADTPGIDAGKWEITRWGQITGGN